MLYSAAAWPNITEDWDKAAEAGGCEPVSPRPGTPRVYGVEAWLCVTEGIVKVSDVWLSELNSHVRKALRKELGLPVKKQLFYRRDNDITDVADFRIRSVWRDCCALELRLADGATPALSVNSMWFAEMN